MRDWSTTRAWPFIGETQWKQSIYSPSSSISFPVPLKHINKAIYFFEPSNKMRKNAGTHLSLSGTSATQLPKERLKGRRNGRYNFWGTFQRTPQWTPSPLWDGVLSNYLQELESAAKSFCSKLLEIPLHGEVCDVVNGPWCNSDASASFC